MAGEPTINPGSIPGWASTSLQLEARLFHLTLPEDAFERHRDGFDWCDETSIAYLSAMHRTNAPPPARALTISPTFSAKLKFV